MTIFSSLHRAMVTLILSSMLSLMATSASANELDLDISPVLYSDDAFLLAQSDTSPSEYNYTSGDAQVSREKPFLTNNRIHQILGLGSMAFAIAAGIAGPENENGVRASSSKVTMHKALGITAAALGGAAIANGFYIHADDFKLSNGLMDPDNLHVMLTVLGTAGFIAALATNGKGIHATAGIGGAAVMAAGIVLEW
ncbi:MAG: hypothetical protein ACE5E3_00300 [Mariprofundus sp.]